MLAGLKLKRNSIFIGQLIGRDKNEFVDNLKEKVTLSEGFQ